MERGGGMTPRFECHSHTDKSDFRLVDAINAPTKLVDQAIKIGLQGVCVTDHETVAACPGLNQYYWNKIHDKYPYFKIGLGDEIYLTETREPNQKYYHFILIAKNIKGWHQLCRLSTIAWLNSYVDRRMERVPTLKSDLAEIVGAEPDNLIASTACLGGEISTLILEMEEARRLKNNEVALEKYQKIKSFITWCQSLFHDDFYLEVQPAKSREQIIVNKKMVEIARAMNLKIILTTDAHYLTKDERYIHEGFLNSKDGEREVASFYEYAYLQTEDEIIENLQPSIPDAYEWMCQNTMEIYDKIEMYNLAHPQTIPKVPVKSYPKKVIGEWEVPFTNGEVKYPNLYRMYQSDNDSHRYWVNQCVDKLKELNLYNDEYLKRLELEADIKETVSKKNDTNIFDYPIVLQHYIDMFWELGSTVGAGRGSAGGGLNHWLLGITQIDPVKYDLPFERYMNWATSGLPDIDIDLVPSKRPLILEKIRQERSQYFKMDLKEEEKKNLGCTLVGTYGTASSRRAIQVGMKGYRSEEYPEGIDVDISQYIASLVPSERGQTWSIDDVYYGNEEKDRKPSALFKQAIDQFPGLLDIVKGIEGLCVSRSSHASGVIMNDENPYEFLAYMRTPSGEVITQFDLHTCEWLGATKYDYLLTAVQEKLATTIRLLQRDGVIDDKLSLREAYEKYLDPMKIDYDDPKLWDEVCAGQVLDMFQFDSDIGAVGLKQVQPRTLEDLSNANGLIRLMAEDGKERPMEKFVRFKDDSRLFEKEMIDYGLNEQQRQAVHKYLDSSYGVCISQEAIMWSLMDPDICGFTLGESNKARKVISKKRFDQLASLREEIKAKATSRGMADYVWDIIVAPSKGYGFSRLHALVYAMIGIQTILLATKFNPIYWNTACLIVNSNSQDDNNNDDLDIEVETKEKGSDYGKIATAIGKIRSKGIKVSCVNINKSDYTFVPDAENNQIIYGLKPLSNLNSEIVEDIISKRPFKGIKDFLARCPQKRQVVINLIKAGAFDDCEENFDRKEVMAYDLVQISKLKKKLNLQNFNGLIQTDCVSKEVEKQVRIFNFNKYLKSLKNGEDYLLNDTCMNFLEKFMPETLDSITIEKDEKRINAGVWDKKFYQPNMDIARQWLKDNHDQVLKTYNNKLFLENWNKYAKGTISTWEMASMRFYYHEHELAHVDLRKYGVTNFEDIDVENQVSHYYKRGPMQYPIYKLSRIIGTVISKNDNRSSIKLLTTGGVVNVKFPKEYYSMWKKQISKINPDGKKSVLEKGWFTAGTLLMVTGYRRDDDFVEKTYKDSQTHGIYKITDVIGSDIIIQHERMTVDGGFEEDEEEAAS